MFCIDFEANDLISKTFGVYRPWVLNDGVTVVNDSQCPQGDRCGYFNNSVLEVPFFSNNYAQWPSMRITLQYKMISFSGSIDQGIISNDCLNLADYAAGNSLYLSADASTFKAGLKSGNASVPDADATVVSTTSSG